MATLKTNTLTGTSTAGSIAVTGEGNSTTTNLQQGLTKAWVNLNGTGTPAINDSFNISGLTDDATGSFTVSFTNDMSNSSYSAAHAGGQRTVTWGIYLGGSGGANATGSHSFHNVSPSDSSVDSAFNCLQFCGDLA
jgi:hypothetical protein